MFKDPSLRVWVMRECKRLSRIRHDTNDSTSPARPERWYQLLEGSREYSAMNAQNVVPFARQGPLAPFLVDRLADAARAHYVDLFLHGSAEAGKEEDGGVFRFYSNLGMSMHPSFCELTALGSALSPEERNHYKSG